MTAKRPIISIIIPAYKAENYIRKCLDSIVYQTLKDIEIIIVDDCSPDCTGYICDEYARKDTRIRVIHKKKNGGVGAARQTGLESAKGEYVIHADPDDWMEPKMLEDLYITAKETNADLVFCDFYQDYADGRSKYMSQQLCNPITNKNMLIAILEGNIHGSCWNKLIKREQILKYRLKFVSGINTCEDRQFCLELLLNDISISYLNKAYYHYCFGINNNSLTANTLKELNYKVNKYFIDFAVKNMSCIPYYRDRYIIGNIYFVAISSPISQKSFCEEFKPYIAYIRHVVPFFRYFVVKTSFYGLKTFWYSIWVGYHKCYNLFCKNYK